MFGLGFALIARDRIRADGPFAAPAFQLVALHAAAAVAPVALYFYWVHPAWSWMYAVDIAKLGGVAVLPLTAGHVGIVIAAWYGTALLLRRGFQNLVLYMGGGIVLAMLILVIAGMNRLTTAGDFRGWRIAGQAQWLFSVQLGWAFLISLLAIFGSAIYVAIELGRDGRRVRSR
ncbi:MAG: hypothetical protein AB7P03_12225 [Kofleriaceae bacterium]